MTGENGKLARVVRILDGSGSYSYQLFFGDTYIQLISTVGKERIVEQINTAAESWFQERARPLVEALEAVKSLDYLQEHNALADMVNKVLAAFKDTTGDKQ